MCEEYNIRVIFFGLWSQDECCETSRILLRLPVKWSIRTGVSRLRCFDKNLPSTVTVSSWEWTDVEILTQYSFSEAVSYSCIQTPILDIVCFFSFMYELSSERINIGSILGQGYYCTVRMVPLMFFLCLVSVYGPLYKVTDCHYPQILYAFHLNNLWISMQS